jgi:hypothetical protein
MSRGAGAHRACAVLSRARLHFSNQDKHAELLRVNLFSFGTSHEADIKYRDQPTAPERIERLYYGEDGVAAFARTGGHVLSVQESVEGKVDLVLVCPEGDPFKLIKCLANLSISVQAIVDELSRMAGPMPYLRRAYRTDLLP